MISKLKAIELSFVVLILIVLTLFLANNSSITGFIITDTYSQKLDLNIEESQLIKIESLSEKPIKISSLKLSGEVIGDGLTEIYLTDNNQKFLVYSNLQKKKKGISKITGAAVRILEGEPLQGELIMPEEYETLSGAFKQECLETCFLNLQATNYYLEVWIQQGTRVRITELKYSVRE